MSRIISRDCQAMIPFMKDSTVSKERKERSNLYSHQLLVLLKSASFFGTGEGRSSQAAPIWSVQNNRHAQTTIQCSMKVYLKDPTKAYSM